VLTLPDTIYLSVALRTILAFFAILLVTRILGKEQMGELTFYEYVTGITIGSLAADMATITIISPWVILTSLVMFAALTFLMGYVSLKNRAARKLLEGEPTLVIQNGKILAKSMAGCRYNIDDLLLQLRTQGVFSISDVEFAVLESNGQLSVLRKSQKQPVTREDLKIPTDYEGLSSEVIVDGEVIYQNLQQNNLDEAWLIHELEQRGIHSPKEIMLASLDTRGNLYVDKKMDGLQATQISDR
jgi:uncharacterized membrane protein YcaP (DUF421 family)